MLITSAEIFDVDLFPQSPSWNLVLLRLHTSEGISGLGEVALAYGTGSAAAVGMLRQLIERFVIGADARRPEQLWHALFRGTFWGQGGGPVVYGAMSAIDEALWDIKGKALGRPVYDLLGGKTAEEIRVYANGWYCRFDADGRHVSVTPADYAEAARRAVSDGFDALKFDPFAVTREGQWRYPQRALSRELADLAYERVVAVREAVGPDVDILIEVHGNLGPASAIEMGRRFAELRPLFYEEPVDATNVECMLKVAQAVPLPIAAGERLYTRYGFRPYIEKQAVDIIQPDVGLAGGITEVKKIAALAETYGLHVQPHNCAGPVATAAAVQIDACITNFLIQEWFPYRDPIFCRLVREPLEPKVAGSRLVIPDDPGLGVELDDEFIRRYPCARVDASRRADI